MRDVFLPQLDRFLVVLEIVITVGHAQSALVHLGNDLAGVLEVRSGIEAEQHVGALAVLPHDLFRKFLF